MKNLANCTPREFVRQTNRIRKSAQNWLKLTDIVNIRRRLPKIGESENVAPEVRKAMLDKQAADNINAILEAVLEKHPDETVELLGLMCFIEPEELDNHKMSELLGGYAEMIGCSEVIDFFVSLAQLARIGGFGDARA